MIFKKYRFFSLICLAAVLLMCSVGCNDKDVVRNNGEEFFKDEIVISAFWPPMLDFVNDTQFQYMKDAHIDLMEYGNDPIFNDPDSVKKMLKLCEKYNIYVTLYDNAANGWLNTSDEDIQKIAKKWMEYEGVVGFFLRDEPQNANPYGRVTKAIREVFPNAICQMNMLPYGALKDAKAHAEDWVSSVGMGNLSYLSFDQYPFGLTENSRPQMFYNLNLVREIGLKYDVKTACYIQSISNTTGFRDPTVNETRYHTSAALAYGIKNIKYFTWMTPVDRNEVFTNAIINPDGTKNSRYDGIVDINTKIKSVSHILGRTDALQVYHTTIDDSDTLLIPKKYFIKPLNDVDAIISLMADKYNDDNYLMIVNKDFVNEREMSFTLDGVSLVDVSSQNNSNDELSGDINISIKAGDFKLYKILGKDVRPEFKDAHSKNLAYKKPVYSSKSVGENGWYNCKAVDGFKYSSSTSKGYKLDLFGDETYDKELFFMIDLLREAEFNKIVIYPTGSEDKFDSNYPLSYDIYVSSDMQNYSKLVSYNRNEKLEAVPEFTFDTVKARYVKIVFTQPDIDMEIDGVAFSEIEIYNS